MVCPQTSGSPLPNLPPPPSPRFLSGNWTLPTVSLCWGEEPPSSCCPCAEEPTALTAEHLEENLPIVVYGILHKETIRLVYPVATPRVSPARAGL